MKKIPIIFIVMTFISCNNHEKGAEDGGPCVFTDEISPITVASISQTADSLFNIDFFWGDSTGHNLDTSRHLDFYDVNHKFLTAAEISEKNIRPGTPAQYVLSRTIHGSCNYQKAIRF